MTRSSTDRPVRRAYKFVLLVLLIYALVTPIWWWLSPVYSRALCSAANCMFQFNLLSSDEMVYSYENGSITGEITFLLTTLADGREARVAARPVWEARLHHFSFTIWAALLLATPFGNWKKKLLYFFLGWAIVFAGQLFALFVETLSEKSLFLQSEQMFQQYRLAAIEEYILNWGGMFFLLVGNKLLPLVLWFLWGLPYLLRRRSEEPEGDAPEPAVT